MLISATVIFKSVYSRFMFYLNINEIESINLKKTQIYFREIISIIHIYGIYIILEKQNLFGTTLHSNHNSECKRQDRLKRRRRTRKLNEHMQAKIEQRQTRMKTPSGSARPLLLQRSCWLLPFCISSLNVFHLYFKPNNFPNLYPNVFLYKLD